MTLSPVQYRKAFLSLVLLFVSLPLSAEVTLQLDRQRVTVGETVTLTFVTNDAKQSLDADFSVLEQDFEIIDRRSETQLSIVNGRQTAQVKLLLTVEPRRSGRVTIPAFGFGGASTEPVVLQVDEAPQLQAGELPPVFLEVELAPERGPYYVHAQLGLIVRVFYQQNLTEAAIGQPDPAPAAVRLLQETPYQAERGGKRFRVLERRYAIFPERSGELVVPPMELSGRLVERRDGSIWQPAVRGRRITVASEPIRVPIEARPLTFSGRDWQPAHKLNLSQQVSSTEALRVGEPVTRTIIIDAVGLEENMIAEPAWPEVPGARIYPDQPQGITRDDGQWVLGHKEFRYAIVPEQEGELVLPELAVHWWDTKADQQRVAVLPAQSIKVLPSALLPSAEPAPERLAEELSAAQGPGAGATARPNFWRSLALLFAGGWLLTLGGTWYYVRQRSRRSAAVSGQSEPEGDESRALGRLQAACRRNDTAAARRYLLDWLKAFGPGEALSLREFAALSADAALRDEIDGLDSAGFRKSAAAGNGQSRGGDWKGQAFWGAFEQWRRASEARARRNSPSATDLYAPANRRG
jgi:hypothetical protein